MSCCSWNSKDRDKKGHCKGHWCFPWIVFSPLDSRFPPVDLKAARGIKAAGWSTATMYRCQRTHEVRSTRPCTTLHPIAAPHITHRHPPMPRYRSTPPHSSAPQITPHPFTRPPTRRHQHMSPHTAKTHGTAQRDAHKHKKTLHLSSPRNPRKEPSTSPTTSSSRITSDGAIWSKSAASWERGRFVWIRSSTQVSYRCPTMDSFLPVGVLCLTQTAVRGLMLAICAGMAALHEAVLTGNLEVVKLLVKYGADVHQRDEDGWTPLHMACSDSYPEIAR